jgi:hypothetical protein
VLNLSIPYSMSSERKPKDVIVFKVSKSPTLWVVVPDLVWVPSLSLRSEKSIQIVSWKLSPSYLHQRSPIPSLNHTTPPSQSINLSKMPMSVWSLITKLFMISVSEPLSSPPQLMVILTISSPLPCQVSPVVSVSQVNLTVISVNWPSTLSPSHVSISSWLVLPHLPQEVLNNTEP